ncbi:hypothetical protein [Aquirufa aurantiipilula]|uniref:hypothetical protein n=1 Tax=Aquirufa aurantiipilula TaxID=2696561 RepID=UPI001CAA6240|nr:hypothetical protein [Aquirufa aurantiipilula]MBZ1327010.1 hypothetical protein [Aquirufa aurantiipilula]
MQKIYFLILVSFVLTSCYQKVWKATITHKQVMESFNTKEIILSKFGLPTSKKTEGEYEEWFYDYGTKIITDQQTNSAARVNGYGAYTGSSAATAGYNVYRNPTIVGNSNASYGTSAYGNSSSNTRQVVKEHKTYIKFTILNNKIINWETNGIDYGKYEIVKQKMHF